MTDYPKLHLDTN